MAANCLLATFTPYITVMLKAIALAQTAIVGVIALDKIRMVKAISSTLSQNRTGDRMSEEI